MGRRNLSTEAAEARNLALAREAATVCDERRGREVCILDLRNLCSFTDFFVIASATSLPQMKGIAHEVEKTLRRHDAQLLNRDESDGGRWWVLDYGDVVVHLLNEEARRFYQVEELWGDAPRIEFERVRQPDEDEDA